MKRVRRRPVQAPHTTPTQQDCCGTAGWTMYEPHLLWRRAGLPVPLRVMGCTCPLVLPHWQPCGLGDPGTWCCIHH